MSPLTKKGKSILRSMRKTYKNEDKVQEVFNASINKGTITGAEGGKTHTGRKKGSR